LLADYGYMALFLLFAIFFAVSTLLLPSALRRFGIVPKNPSPVKTSPFECGLRTIGKTWVQFNFRYYYYALLFIALDVLVVFLYPWAVGLKELGASALGMVAVLVLVILVGYIYAWRKKVLEWK